MKHVEVVAAVIIRDGKVFAAQRKDAGEMACRWEFPGGKVEDGESSEEALVREIREELDSVISVDRYIMTVEHAYHSFSLTMHAYLCTLVEGELSLEEHLAFRWLDKDSLFSVAWADADVPIAQAIKDRVV
ncbi:(deoxy)nucleoside triphosphate pyrophosphohydrolase [Parasphaerochaeta coccoides]|uniref:8-oxo-dGTP diphosphatase n=1 Tax=Parasphaerochaeta coccoides (strain ATCC BAA-1237 / DSM 17374 / SPN1) TaxID=760011 RepID=F4GLN5_PARC1|nr:(deoxy)nucleoside triphosphate pyrophosphohydrolase [Parasphaerochaeta coccoides]AEC02429.1 NUDIX hydrolase [Parasphaerochaeta coccoides DSM 17374]